LRSSALSALAQTEDLAILDSLLNYAKPGNPRATRGSALRGLIQLAQKAKPDEGQRKQILGALSTALEGDNMMVQFSVLGSLNNLGTMATELLPAVDKISRDASNERIRAIAKQAAKRIRNQAKATAPATAEEVKKLRDEVERLKREQAELLKRLQKLEKEKTK
jgi:ubiquinone biosynthesis protein UbiJ